MMIRSAYCILIFYELSALQSPSDLVCSKTLYRIPFLKIACEQADKQMSGFHYQRNVTIKFTQIEPSGLLHLAKSYRSITGTVQNRRYHRTQTIVTHDSLSQGHRPIDRAVRVFKKSECL